MKLFHHVCLSALAVIPSIGAVPTSFNLMAYNATGTTMDGVNINGQLLYGTDSASALAGFAIPTSDGPDVQTYHLDEATGYLYDGSYPLTIAPPGYSNPGSGASGGYPWTAALYGRGDEWANLVCDIDDDLLLHCGLPSCEGPDSPTGVTYGQWFCGIPLYGTGIGCYLFGGLNTTPSGSIDPTQNGFISLDLKVVAV